MDKFNVPIGSRLKLWEVPPWISASKEYLEWNPRISFVISTSNLWRGCWSAVFFGAQFFWVELVVVCWFSYGPKKFRTVVRRKTHSKLYKGLFWGGKKKNYKSRHILRKNPKPINRAIFRQWIPIGSPELCRILKAKQFTLWPLAKLGSSFLWRMAASPPTW